MSAKGGYSLTCVGRYRTLGRESGKAAPRHAERPRVLATALISAASLPWPAAGAKASSTAAKPAWLGPVRFVLGCPVRFCAATQHVDRADAGLNLGEQPVLFRKVAKRGT